MDDTSQFPLVGILDPQQPLGGAYLVVEQKAANSTRTAREQHELGSSLG